MLGWSGAEWGLEQIWGFFGKNDTCILYIFMKAVPL